MDFGLLLGSPGRRGGVMWPFEGFFKMRRVALWIHYFDEFVMFWRVALWLCFGPGRVAVSWHVLACLAKQVSCSAQVARCAQDARALAQDVRKMRARSLCLCGVVLCLV